MKICRYGLYQDKGTTVLIDRDLTKELSKPYSEAKWDSSRQTLMFSVVGRPSSNATYIYNIEISGAEIAFLFADAISKCSPDMGLDIVAKMFLEHWKQVIPSDKEP